MNNEKYCSVCLYKKERSEFTERKSSKDGKSRMCKLCAKKENVKTTARNKKRSDKAAKLRAVCRAEDKKKTKNTPGKENEKKCTKCRQFKSMYSFDDCKYTKNSKNLQCKLCLSYGVAKNVPTETERAKRIKIMAVPVNVTKTQAYYMGHKHRQEQKGIWLR